MVSFTNFLSQATINQSALHSLLDLRLLACSHVSISVCIHSINGTRDKKYYYVDLLYTNTLSTSTEDLNVFDNKNFVVRVTSNFANLRYS